MYCRVRFNMICPPENVFIFCPDRVLPIMPCEAVSDFPEQMGCLQQSAQRRTFVHLSAVRAGIQSLFPDAVMYGAELVAERRFCALHSAAGAVDHFRRDRDPVELCPQFSGYLAQGVVVCKRCDSGIAGFAVQSAAADQLVCVFHNLLRK